MYNYKSLKDIIEKPQSGDWGEDAQIGNGTPVLRTTNFTNTGDVNYQNVVTRIIDSDKFAKKALRKGDIIIEKSGGSEKQPVGRVIYFDGEENKYLFNNFTSVIRVKKGLEINSKYLFYYLFRFYKRGGTLVFQNKTTGLHNLKLDQMINSLEVPILEFKMQMSISSTLDSLRRIIVIKEQQLRDYDQLIKSRFVEMFGDPITNNKGWDVKDLNEITDVRDGTHDSPKYVDIGYPFVTSKNLVNGNIDFSTCQLISKDDLEKINQRSFVDDGDILMPMIGTIGGAIIVKKDRDFAIKNVALIKFNKENSIVDRKFILNVLNSDSMNEFFNSIKKGGTQNFISLGLIRKIPTIIPPLKLQNEFALFVEQVDKLKFNIQKSLDETQLLFDSLMQKYFS